MYTYLFCDFLRLFLGLGGGEGVLLEESEDVVDLIASTSSASSLFASSRSPAFANTTASYRHRSCQCTTHSDLTERVAGSGLMINLAGTCAIESSQSNLTTKKGGVDVEEIALLRANCLSVDMLVSEL